MSCKLAFGVQTVNFRVKLLTAGSGHTPYKRLRTASSTKAIELCVPCISADNILPDRLSLATLEKGAVCIETDIKPTEGEL